MVPPLDHFQGKNKNCSYLARAISTSRRSFFSNLTTFERRSGLKKFSFTKSQFSKLGGCQNFKVIGSEEMPILVWGRRKRPPNKYGINLRLINFDNHPIVKIYNLLLLFLFFWPYPIMGFELGLRLSLEIKQSPECLPNNLQIVS